MMEGHDASRQGSGGCLRLMMWGGGLLVVLVIIVIAVASGFASKAKTSVAAEIARMKDAGEPTCGADLAPPKLADSENGAVDIAAAEKEIAAFPAMDLKWLESTDLGIDGTPAPADVDRARDILKRLAGPLDRARLGLAKPRIIFMLDYSTVTNAQPVPDLAWPRRLARLLQREAFIAALDGRGDEAAARVADICRFADALRDQPAYITQLVAVTLRSISRNAAERVVAHARVSPAVLRDLSRRFAAAPEDQRKGYVRALQGERAHLMSISNDAAGSFSPFERLWRRSDESVYLREFRKWIDSLDASRLTYPAPAWPTPRVPFYYTLSMMTVTMGPFRLMPGQLTSSAAHMRTAAIGLEIAARIEEGAAVPADLSSFDRSISIDPLTAKPLLIKNDGITWAVYSVGENLRDDGGVPKPRKSNPYAASGPDDIAFRVPLKR